MGRIGVKRLPWRYAVLMGVLGAGGLWRGKKALMGGERIAGRRRNRAAPEGAQHSKPRRK